MWLNVSMTPWYVWAFDGVAGAAVVGIGIAVYQRYASKADRSGSSPKVSTSENSRTVNESPATADMSGPITDSQVAVGSNISQSVAVHHHYGENETSQKLTPTEPTPFQIIKAIRSVKPFDKHREREKFVDLDVIWRVRIGNLFPTELSMSGDKFESLKSSANGAWMVTCVFDRFRDSEEVMVQFFLSEVPLELKIGDRHTSFYVQGRVEKVEQDAIHLRPNPRLLGFESS
jgi:hypothetical protein